MIFRDISELDTVIRVYKYLSISQNSLDILGILDWTV